MNRLLPIILLALAVFFKGAEASWSTDYSKGENAAQREGVTTALRNLKPLAEQGNADAQFKMGVVYDKRQGVPKDYKISVKLWSRLATEQGNARAQHNLGWLYQQGKGVPKNNDIAAKWWTLAAKHGLNNALFFKGLLYLFSVGEIQNQIFSRLFDTIFPSRKIGVFDNAAYWYLLAAEQGHTDAQSNLGVMYYKGKGVPRDYKSAVRWFRFAAEQRHADAQHSLGMMYQNGNGVPRSYKTAIRCFRLASEQGHADATFDLGLMYYTGDGVRQNRKTALKWFRLAAEQGHVVAQFNLGLMYNTGEGVRQNSKTALKWYRLAAEQGYAEAQFNLGMIYYKGPAATQDYVYAYMWEYIAASNGVINARKIRDLLAKELAPSQIAKAQKLARACILEKYKGC